MSRRMLALAACWVLVNLASVTHTAWSFAQLERPGWWWLVGVVAAVGTDAGMAALTWLAMERRREQRPFGWPVLGVLIAGGAVAYANVDHALGVVGAWGVLTWWVRSRVLVLSLVLPGLTVLMSALVEHEHAGEHGGEWEDEHAEHNTREVERARAAAEARERDVEGWGYDRERVGEWERLERVSAKLVSAAERGVPIADADRLALVLAHVAAHPRATDVDITSATGVPRATVGRWRRAGMLSEPPAQHSLNGKVSG